MDVATYYATNHLLDFLRFNFRETTPSWGECCSVLVCSGWYFWEFIIIINANMTANYTYIDCSCAVSHWLQAFNNGNGNSRHWYALCVFYIFSYCGRIMWQFTAFSCLVVSQSWRVHLESYHWTSYIVWHSRNTLSFLVMSRKQLKTSVTSLYFR